MTIKQDQDVQNVKRKKQKKQRPRIRANTQFLTSATSGVEKAEDINKIRHLLKDSDNVTFKLSCKDYYGEVEYL